MTLALLISLSLQPVFLWRFRPRLLLTAGGASMLASRDTFNNVLNPKDHTTLVAAVQAAGLVDTLKESGLFTVCS